MNYPVSLRMNMGKGPDPEGLKLSLSKKDGGGASLLIIRQETISIKEGIGQPPIPERTTLAAE